MSFAAQAANFTTAVQQGTANHWGNAIWNPGPVSPTAGNTYECIAGGGPTRVRNPASGSGDPVIGVKTFPGNSLQLDAGSEVRAKGVGNALDFPGVGSNAGLILNGGNMDTGDNAVFPLTGVVVVQAASSFSCGDTGGDNTRGWQIAAQIRGSAGLTVTKNNFAGGVPAVELTGVNNPFSGTWTVIGGTLKATGAGSLGTNSITINPGAVGAQLEIMYDTTTFDPIRIPGALTLQGASVMILHQNCQFSAVTINGTALARGTYTYTQLAAQFPGNFAPGGSGSITVGPLAPSGLVAQPGNAQVTLLWDSMPGADNGYNIYRGAAHGGPYTFLANTFGSPGFQDTTVVNGTTYYYVVTGINLDNVESAKSAEVSATPVAPPVAPTGVAAANGDTQVALSWNPVPTATGYQVKRGSVSGGYDITFPAITNTSYIDTGLVNGQTYYYVVEALNAGGQSPPSAEVIGQPNTAPTGVTAINEAGRISLSWNPGAFTSYNVKRSSSSGGPYVTIATGLTGNLYTNSGLADGAIYYYVVSGQLLNGHESANSRQVVGSALLRGTPAPLTATDVRPAEIDLAWSSVSGATTYQVESSTNGTDFILLATVNAPTTSYADTNAFPGTLYSYRVRASNGVVDSPYSNIALGMAYGYAVRVNFGLASATDFYPGYLQDGGAVYGDRGNGFTYGWTLNTANVARERGAGNSPDKRYDTLIHLMKPAPDGPAGWAIALPNGTYTVLLVAGDASNFDSDYQFIIGDVTTPLWLRDGVNHWHEFTNVTVTVTNGLLTITNGPLASNNKICFLDVSVPQPTPPSITSQPQNQTIIEMGTATFTVGVAGSPLAYYWYYNTNVLLPSETTGTLVITNAPLTAAGTYDLVVSNFLGSVTSRVATLTVTKDTFPPYLISAAGDPTYTGVTIIFSERITEATATDTFNYNIKDNVGGDLPIASAVLLPGSTAVLLTTANQTPGTRYTITVNSLRDFSPQANKITNDSQISFTAWVETIGYLKVETYLGIVNNDVASLSNSTKFVSNLPDSVGYLTSFSYANGQVNYGDRISGYFIAPSNGTYRFYLRSDDASQLYLNPAGTDPAGKVLIAREDGCCHSYDPTLGNADSVSAGYSLNAGQRYYIEALHKQGAGGEYVQVAFREAADLSIPASPTNSNAVGAEVAPGQFFSILANPDPVSLLITQQPQGTNTFENRTVTFSVATSVAPSNVISYLTYQWQRNGTNIPGANGATYTTPLLTVADSNSTYVCIVRIPGATVMSSNALLRVQADTAAPRIVSAGSLDGLTVGVLYDELLDTNFPPTGIPAALDPLNYSVFDALGNPITLNSVLGPNGHSVELWGPDDQSVILLLASPVSGRFTVTVSGVDDRKGNFMTSSMTVTGRVVGLRPVDIGAPAVAGSNFVSSPEMIQLSGGGSDIWGNADHFQFAYSQLTGDFDAKVLLSNVRAFDTSTKVGLMVRETTDPTSRNLHAIVMPPAPGRNIYESGTRLNTGDANTVGWGTAGGVNGNIPATYPNCWIRLTRVGNTFTAYAGTNGTDWTQLGQTNQTYPPTVLFGLAVTAHNNNTNPAVATFRNLSIVQYDFGDAPDPAYPTLLAHNGARHILLSGFRLGALIDGETDGKPNANATGDPDDDGVSFITTPLVAGQSATVRVLVSLPPYLTQGRLDAWVDFNANGSWADSGEQTFANRVLTAGANTLTFTVPPTAVAGSTFARFRLSSTGGLSFTGLAADGEVEDYQVSIERGTVTQPQLINVGFDSESHTASFTFATEVGVSYVVEYKKTLDDPSWQTLTIVPGDGSVKTIPDPQATDPTRFYRVRVQ